MFIAVFLSFSVQQEVASVKSEVNPKTKSGPDEPDRFCVDLSKVP
jgi:hypothetical protein